MVNVNCSKSIEKNTDRSLISEDEINAIVDEAEAIAKGSQYANERSIPEVVKDFLDQKKVSEEEKALIAARKSAYNSIARSEILQTIQSKFKGNEDGGVIAMFYGDPNHTELSVDSMNKTYQSKWMNKIDTDLTSINERAVDVVKTGKTDPDIVEAMYRLKRGEDVSGIDSTSVETARAVNDLFEVIRKELNASGALIKGREDWIWRTAHDQRKIARATREEWAEVLAENIDYKESFGFTEAEMQGSEELRKYFKEQMAEWYKAFKTGIHLTESGGGAGDISQAAGARRSIHFKDAQSFLAYNKQFGRGTVFEAINAQIRSSARTISFLKKLGPNWEDNINAVISTLKKQAGDDSKLGSNAFKGRLERAKRHATGAYEIPENIGVANTGIVLRTIQVLSKMGSATLSALSDVVNVAMESKVKGRGFLSGYKTSLVESFTNVADRERIAKRIGAGMDVMRGTLMNDIMSADSSGGKAARLQNVMFRLNGLQWWTNAQRRGLATAEAIGLGDLSGMKFNELDVKNQRFLELAEIGEAEWDAIRKAVTDEDINGETFQIVAQDLLTDTDILDNAVPDSVIIEYLNRTGRTASQFSIKKARSELADKLSAYYRNAIDSGVVEPNLRSRATILQSAQSGTVTGEVWRSMALFKSFPISIVGQRVFRDIRARTGKTVTESMNFRDALNLTNGWGWNTANMMVQTAIFGYASMVLKDISKRREPRDPTDGKTVVAALIQGGGLGIYGDFLFGEIGKGYGKSLASTALGPVAGMLDQVADVFQRAKSGDDVASSFLRTVYNNTPFANLFYTRLLVDYFFMERLFNEINPGQAQRRAKRLFRENGQTMIWNQTEGF